jgi:hypothetical protein
VTSRKEVDVPYEQNVQLRVPFTRPDDPVRIHLALSGMVVLVAVVEGRDDVAGQYLASAGVPVQVSEPRGLSFPAVKLPRLTDLPEQVMVSVDEQLKPVWMLLTHPSEAGMPATLAINVFGELELSWFDGTNAYDEVLADKVAPVLLQTDLPFVATAEAWDRLESATTARVLAGVLRTNLDGYVEVDTSRPQLVEVAPIPGLFKVDERHFGVPLPYLSALSQAEGFRWEGPRPVLERAPGTLPPMPVALSAHHQRDLQQMVEQLAAYRAQVICWESGLGRRVFALAALEALDAWPALVVTPPSSIWPWLRHTELLGRSAALTHQRADVHLVTYHDLPHRRDLAAPQTIIFDDLFTPEACTPAARDGLRRLDALMGAYRVAVTSHWPDDVAEQIAAMANLRPGEFAPGVPLPTRYPVDPAKRAGEHVGAYLSVRRLSDPDTDRTSFKRSTTVTVDPSEAQLKELDRLLERTADRTPAVVLAQMMEVVSAGPAASVSPKVAAAVDRARRAAEAGARVAVATRHRRTATLLAASLRGIPGRPVTQADASSGAPDGELVVLRFDRSLCDLRRFDVVVLVDYPWSLDEIDRAVGSASEQAGCQLVVVIHAVGTVDDRVALLAARRREVSVVSDASSPPSPAEVDYLLRSSARALDEPAT